MKYEYTYRATQTSFLYLDLCSTYVGKVDFLSKSEYCENNKP